MFTWSFFEVYTVVTVALAVAVYSYGTAFLFPALAAGIGRIADAAFLVSLLIPPAVFATWLLTVSVSWILEADSGAAAAVTGVLGMIVGMFTTGAVYVGQKKLADRREQTIQERFTAEVDAGFAQAKGLLRQGMYEQAVLQAYMSLEAAAKEWLRRRRRLKYGHRVEHPLQALQRQPEMGQRAAEVAKLMKMRNEAIHSEVQYSKKDTIDYLARVKVLLDVLAVEPPSANVA